jgi:hypothetical protein
LDFLQITISNCDALSFFVLRVHGKKTSNRAGFMGPIRKIVWPTITAASSRTPHALLSPLQQVLQKQNERIKLLQTEVKRIQNWMRTKALEVGETDSRPSSKTNSPEVHVFLSPGHVLNSSHVIQVHQATVETTSTTTVPSFHAEQDALPRSHARTATGPGHLGNQSMSLSLLRGKSKTGELLRDVEQTAGTDMLREDTDKVPECNSVLMSPSLDTTSQKRAGETTEKNVARAWSADNLRKKELGENHTLTGELSKRIQNQQGIKIIPLEKTFGPELRDFHDTLHLEINTLQPGVKTVLYTLDGSEPNLHRFDGSG